MSYFPNTKSKWRNATFNISTLRSNRSIYTNTNVQFILKSSSTSSSTETKHTSIQDNLEYHENAYYNQGYTIIAESVSQQPSRGYKVGVVKMHDAEPRSRSGPSLQWYIFRNGEGRHNIFTTFISVSSIFSSRQRRANLVICSETFYKSSYIKLF